MTEAVDAFRAEYREAFGAHLVAGGEAGLRAAYEMGREAMAHRLSVLDLASVHHDVLVEALAAAEGPRDLRAAADAAALFFLEVLSTYEMVQRGFAEAHETARLEQQHSQQLRKLADASIAISAAGSLDELAERIGEQAVSVLDARRATVTVPPSTERTYPRGAAEPAPGAERLRAALARRNGTSLAVLEVIAAEGQTFSGNDESILTQLAQLAGVALENAELYDQERLVAETLQRRLLPDRLPDFPGVSMAWRYLPGWAGSNIGGDWYDALVLPDQRLALAVGDVIGKGIRAAAGMGQLRIALRAYAVEGHPAAEVIERLDRLFDELEEELATVVYLVYEPATGTVDYANAGHPPPLVVAPDGSTQFLRGALSPPLGCMVGARAGQASTAPAAGSTLVVYTDGLVERRGTDIERGLARLQEVAAAADTTHLDDFCDRLLEGMDAAERGDDIALLAVRLDARGASDAPAPGSRAGGPGR